MRSFYNLSAGYPHTSFRGAFTPLPSDHVDERNLAAGVPVVHAIPAVAAVVIFSATADFRAKFGVSTVSAEIPSGDVTDGSASLLNPAARLIPDGATHIALIAATATRVTLEFYGR